MFLCRMNVAEDIDRFFFHIYPTLPSFEGARGIREAFSAFIDWRFGRDINDDPLYNTHTNTLIIPIDDNDEMYNEQHAPDIDEFILHIRYFQDTWDVPAVLILRVDCFDNIPIQGSERFVPRNMEWIEYVTNGFDWHEVELYIVTPRFTADTPMLENARQMSIYNAYLRACGMFAARLFLYDHTFRPNYACSYDFQM